MNVRAQLCRGALLLVMAVPLHAGDPWRASWIWDTSAANRAPQPAGDRFFRKGFELDAAVNQSHTLVLADNAFELFVNGERVASGEGWWPPVELDISKHLAAGRNVIAIRATNTGDSAGLFFESNLKTHKGELVNVVTDGTWRASSDAGGDWTSVRYDDAKWAKANDLGPMGTPPWGNYGKPGSAATRPASEGPVPGAESMKLFTLPEGFSLELIAEEPDVINPVAMAVDERGRLFVAEAHTYRWGEEKSPIVPARNPVALLERDATGRFRRTAIVAQDFTDPVMGLTVRDGTIWLAELNRLYVAKLNPDGTAGERRIIVHDVAEPWNPFGFFQLDFGPDDGMYLIVGNHDVELIGADGTTVKTRGSTGALFRFRPDGTGLEMLSQGMRAPFSFDFDPFGRVWMLSNGEGNPNRLIMMIPTVDYHFQTRHGDWAWLAGEHPWSPPVVEMERGANTQVVCYLDQAFPERYWGGLFVANWGAHGFASVNHKIDLYTPDERGGIASVEVFLDCADPMFRPTQISEAPDGNLYMLDWYGRDDENDLTGRIYKIVYTGGDAKRSIVKRAFDAGPDLSAEQARALLDIQSTSFRQRDAAMRTLAASGSDAVVGAVLQLLRQDKDPFVSSQLLWVLRRIGTPAAVQAVTDTMQSKFHLVRAQALRLLRDMNAPELKKRAALIADDPDPEVRVEIAMCAAADEKRGRSSFPGGKHPTNARISRNELRPRFQEVVAAFRSGLEAGAIDDRRLRYQCAVELSRRMTAEEYLELARSDNPLERQVAWMALDVAMLEKVNPASRTALAGLLEATPEGCVDAVLALCDRWATADMAEAMQAFLRGQHLSAEQLSASIGILRRINPSAIEGLSGDVVTQFFDGVHQGRVPLPGPAEKTGALRLVESADAGPAGARFVEACLRDGAAEVRVQALRTVRLIAWEHPELLDAVWKLATSENCPPDERVDAIATLGAEDPPDAAKWRTLLTFPRPRVVRAALRTCKQFAGGKEIQKLLLDLAPELAARDANVKDELRAVLGLYGVPAETLARLDLPQPPAARPTADVEAGMLRRLPGGDVHLGREVFERLGCVACHDVAGEAKLFGPSLKGIGQAATPAYIAESVLYPSRVVKDGFESELVRLHNGQTLEGWVERQGNDLIVVRGGLDRVRVAGDDVAERRKLERSPMPELALDGVSLGELADLLTYLVSQGGDPKTALVSGGAPLTGTPPSSR